MKRQLSAAHVEIFGGYTYEHDDPTKRKRQAVHVLLGESEKREEFERLVGTVLSATKDAYDDPANRVRFGYNNVWAAQKAAIGDLPDPSYLISSVAVSELDPEWVKQADPNEVIALAGIMQSCRELAKLEFELDIWLVNSG